MNWKPNRPRRRLTGSLTDSLMGLEVSAIHWLHPPLALLHGEQMG